MCAGGGECVCVCVICERYMYIEWLWCCPGLGQGREAEGNERYSSPFPPPALRTGIYLNSSNISTHYCFFTHWQNVFLPLTTEYFSHTLVSSSNLRILQHNYIFSSSSFPFSLSSLDPSSGVHHSSEWAGVGEAGNVCWRAPSLSSPFPSVHEEYVEPTLHNNMYNLPRVWLYSFCISGEFHWDLQYGRWQYYDGYI